MYKLDIPADYKEAAALERRRTMEEERKARIFNAKVRQIGVDEKVLDQQLRERKHNEAMEKKRDEAYASELKKNDTIAMLLDKRQDEDLRRINTALNDFRLNHQKPSTRREFDIYDPDRLKKDIPARVGDDDPRCGVASLQKFQGEDLNEEARKKLQAEQRRYWSSQQCREREMTKAIEERTDRLYALKMREIDNRAVELERAEEDCKKAINQATKEYNKAMQSETLAHRAARRQLDESDKRTEMANHLYGDFLTENPAAAQSAYGSHRVITDRWKGMNSEQLSDIWREQERQRTELKYKRMKERSTDDEFNKQRLNDVLTATLMEREEERRQKEAAKNLAEENMRLAKEQKDRQQFLNKQVYTNEPTAAYFMQFNTSTR